MGIFENINRFLETQLEEFLRNNPQLELQILEEQLREQKQETLKIIADLQLKEQKIKQQIITTAKDIQRWHKRINKAKSANRQDLAQAAQEREAALRRQGNQLWEQMQEVQARIQKAKELLPLIEQRIQEVRAKAAAEATAKASTRKTQQPQQNINSESDPLEEVFQRWELDDEIEQIKRKING
ncbi:MAG: TIGR04376 family protein [Oscillatoriaceae bacterium SKW80]|nr:TIGR04376 family protein [Oscillatoriaceae bacterium SKYG93]MCX8119475.1 TIGR04376 family protein [Oscillatoriaceae bacterium SKW80]MDW8454941.1 TIGR04376 family protein [Oscillatoriaceae cyanobacterium SKYGB_i_bin93]HIK28281.1 TIGR04376 family protein [Oscillatoriaceae cyanobacterium M7585_C2015_266]